MLAQSLSGPPASVRVHLRRAHRIADCLWRRWHVGPWQWRLKHVRWFLEHRTAHLGPWARYRYWLTILKLLEVRQKAHLWRPGLAGPWTSAKGIRAAKQYARLRTAPR
ncbi:MAG: hypothetical protein ACE5HM_05550 [Acidiferrobacterales bacterium]